MPDCTNVFKPFVGGGLGPMPVEDTKWDAFHIGFASLQKTTCAVNLM